MAQHSASRWATPHLRWNAAFSMRSGRGWVHTTPMTASFIGLSPTRTQLGWDDNSDWELKALAPPTR
jgi:hypothetical protein